MRRNHPPSAPKPYSPITTGFILLLATAAVSLAEFGCAARSPIPIQGSNEVHQEHNVPLSKYAEWNGKHEGGQGSAPQVPTFCMVGTRIRE